MPAEFIIWGVPPGAPDDDETPLITTCKTREHAEKTVKLLADKYQCRNMRIQTIDGSPPDFRAGLNF